MTNEKLLGDKKIRVLHFVTKSEIRRYNLQNKIIKLEVNEKIFPPSAHGSFFAENLKINHGETVLDIGTGSGILAILAAKLGAKVYATDTDEDAIDLAKKNALRNGVKINFCPGEYFANFNRKFDAIIANLPQEIVHKRYSLAIGVKLNRTIDGGKNGNRHLLELLRIAENRMHNNSRLYIIINTVTDYKKTIQYTVKEYYARLINFSSEPTKEFVEDNIDWYKKLNEQGKITIFRDGKKWMAHEYLFELTKKQDTQVN